MKEFNLEAAKAGAPVCTRDGRKARIICFDAKFGHNFFIVALVISAVDGKEMLETYNKEGSVYGNDESPNDLIMETTHREGWMNIYQTSPNRNAVAGTGIIYSTREAAEMAPRKPDKCIATIKVEWEE